MTLAFPTFTAGLVLSLSLIMAMGPQNAHLLRMGLQRQHVWLTAAICMLSDMLLIGIGVLGLAQIGGMSDKLMGALVGAGALFLTVYGWKAFQRFLHPRAARWPLAPMPATAARSPCLAARPCSPRWRSPG